MAKKPPVHTVPHGDGWANRREGSDKVSKTFDTKREAQTAGRDTAQREKTEHVIHKRDGVDGRLLGHGSFLLDEVVVSKYE